MRDNMYEGMWSPFDPTWYQQAFDKFISTSDELFNQDEIINAGYTLPDADGSKSSVFHQSAATNNSFDESVLRDTLSEIYMNSYHRLTAANHDSVHFFQWHGTMKDVTLVPTTHLCELRIPTEGFLDPSSRDKYKFRQFYRKWISLTELMNNWDTFKFTVLLFINQRVYSDYELRIDDQETVIRFRYYDHWRSNKYTNIETGETEEYTDEEYDTLADEKKAVLKTQSYPIYIYRFDTNAQCRVKVSKELITNRWNWKMPMEYIAEERKVGNIDKAKRKQYTCPDCDTQYVLSNGSSIFTDHVMVAFNKISDQDIRTDGNTLVDVLGDNLEFLKIENGCIDLGKCSEYNKHMLVTEEDQWIWMSIMVPKFMHEFPIILPTDVLYRPHVPAYENVKIRNNGTYYNTQVYVPDEADPRFDQRKDVFVDINDPNDTEIAIYLNDDCELVIEYEGNGELTEDNLYIDEYGYLILMSEHTNTDISLSRHHFDLNSVGDLMVDYVWNDGWKHTIRPIVLSDAFDVQDTDMYDRISTDMNELKRLIANGANQIAIFHNFIDYVYTHRKESTWYDPQISVNTLISDEGDLLIEYAGDDPNVWMEDGDLWLEWDETDTANTMARFKFDNSDGFLKLTYVEGDIHSEDSYYIDQHTVVSYDDDFVAQLDALTEALTAIHDEYKSYMDSHSMDMDESYVSLWEEYAEVREDILNSSDYFWAIDRFHRQHGKYRDFWSFISPLIYIPDEFTSTYEVATILKQINNLTLWEDVDKFKSQLRFRRPVDSTDFWMFEYDMDDQCWRPVILNIDHRFPDVYLITDPNESEPTPNRVFKSFVFYTDTPTPTEISTPIVRPTASWTKDLQEYELNRSGSYRDIYMEKFYWVAVKSIYRGLLATKYRWECIEYIQDNANYDRFNTLFLNTMDPYVKMGESTYLKSDNYGFLIDDKIAKMNEYMKAAFLGYDRITGFEMYLNNSWNPSYFDSVIPVYDSFNSNGRLIRRPRSTFDTRRVLRVLTNSQIFIKAAIVTLRDEIEAVREQINLYGVKFQMQLLDELVTITDELETSISECIEFINALDLDIYNIQDVNTIIAYLEKYFALIDKIKAKFAEIINYIGDTTATDVKINLLTAVAEIVRIALYDIIFVLGNYIQNFNMESFMKGVNNYEFFNEYGHEDDDCLIGAINNFTTSWPKTVQSARNDLYVSTAALWAFYNPDKSYTESEVQQMLQMSYTVRNHIQALHTEVFKCWKSETEYDANIVSKFDFASESIETLISSLKSIVNLRSQLFNTFDRIRSEILMVTAEGIDDKEEAYALEIDECFDKILYHLSYVAGENRKTDALNEYSIVMGDVEAWIAYLTRTKEIYIRLRGDVGEPNPFLTTLAPYHEYFEALIEYMKTVDREFIPDAQNPTFASVYHIDEVEMITGGFNHEVGDTAFFDNLGVYTVSEVSGNVNVATALENPNLHEIDLSYDAWLNRYGELIFEIPDIDGADAYINERGQLILTLPSDSTNNIQNYRFSIVNNYLYLTQESTIEFSLNRDCELILDTDEEVEFEMFVNEDGELILTMDEDDSSDLEMYRFYITTDGDLVAYRADNVYYRNTVFRDPCWQSNPYDSTTSGKGLGIAVNAVSSSEIKIYNDTVTDSYTERVKNILKMIKSGMYSINPYHNQEASRLLTVANRVKDDWASLMAVYSENISLEIIETGTEMVNSLDLLITPVTDLINYREQNDLRQLVSDFGDFMDLCDKTFTYYGMRNANYIYFSNRVKEKLQALSGYYGNGMSWDGADELISILDDAVYELKLFNRQMISLLPDPDLKMVIDSDGELVVTVDTAIPFTLTLNEDDEAILSLDDDATIILEFYKYYITENGNLIARKDSSYQSYTPQIETDYASLLNEIDFIKQITSNMGSTHQAITDAIAEIEYKVSIVPEPIRVDEWYRITKLSIAVAGRNYQAGDIVEIVPALPTDVYGNPIHDNEAELMADKLFLKVTQVTADGEVLAAIPLMDYALPYPIRGTRDTITRSGTGEFMKVIVMTSQITNKDCTLFWTDDSYFPPVHQYDENDLFTFKFSNIYDLPLGYDVFFNGKQAHDIIIRHEHEDDPLKPRDVDVVYLKANDVMELADSSVFIEGEKYFIYKLKDLSIVDPGSGYYDGQVIRVGTDQITLKLQVSGITNEKGIADVEMLQNYQLFYGVDPTTNNAVVITDSMNNIDDEYNSGYYDNLPEDGIIKPAAPPYTADEYPFISRRFDIHKGEFRFAIINGELVMDGDTDVEFSLELNNNGEVILTLDENDYIELEEYSFFMTREENLILNRPASAYIGRNTTWMYPDVDFPDGYDDVRNGDPEDHTYLGTREDNSLLDIRSDRWNGISETMPVTDPFIPDSDRVPLNQPTRGEYQLIQSLKIHSGSPTITGDLTVANHAKLPTHIQEWSKASVGKTVIVKKDETMGNHRTLYRVRTFVVSGYIIYDDPVVADTAWNVFDIKWSEIDCYQDLPTLIEQYPSAAWYDGKTYGDIKATILNDEVDRVLTPVANLGTYIDNITEDDLSVYNFTLKQWEDLHDGSRWSLIPNPKGFQLKYLEFEPHSYNMMLFLNKTSVQQLKNEPLKRNAVFNIETEIFDEVNTKSRNISVLTGRDLRIRKLFPYEQKEEYTLDGTQETHELQFKLAPYMHFKNEIHVHDIVLALVYQNGDEYELIRFEDILNSKDEEGNPMYEIQIKDEKAKSRGYETQTTCTVVGYSENGIGFVNGEAWAWNEEFQIHIFGHVESDMLNDGSLIKFIPDHMVNAPTDQDMLLEFKLYQFSTSSDPAVASVMVRIETKRVEVYGDGWLHNVTNPYAPIKDEFKIIIHYDYDDLIQYQIRIDKNPAVYPFIRPQMEIFPTFTIPNTHIPQNRLYMTIDQGRLPLVNPSTGKPSMRVTYTYTDTEVQYLNIYHKYEKMEIHVSPYPMRSVYARRRVPESGYIDLKGKINKPLNKKYFEFWMNGRLLGDEVTIISPTKLFLHGLKSLRNFEIIEINRDPNEFFSDAFVSVETESGIPHPVWNYQTYLDDALEADTNFDVYTLHEQSILLNPVWPQVDITDSQYPVYPGNVDDEDDILLRVDSNADLADMGEAPSFQFSVVDVPTIEGIPIFSRNITFEQFGFKPITEQMIIDMINEEWEEEIREGLIPQPTIISDEDWYGMATRMYNEEGNPVTDPADAAYKVTADQLFTVNTAVKISRILPMSVDYDLT